jgi:hypothetical protein
MTDEVDEVSAASRGSAGGIQGFTAELSDLLNRHSMESASGTPDFILAAYLANCLLAWNQSMQEREAWYGRQAKLYERFGLSRTSVSAERDNVRP